MHKPTFTDSPEQAAVIAAPSDADVLVVAGAGSGKTYTMTRRIVTLIEQGVPAERIVGLTFTRKAAAELLSRVSAAVNANPIADDADAARSRRAFLKPEISTYDAFFQSIVRRYGLLVGFDQNTQPLSEAGAIQLAVEVVDRHAEDVLGADLGAFNTVVEHVRDLSSAIGSAMIGGGVTDMEEAIARIRRWDAAFIERLDVALRDEIVPITEPNPGKPKKRTKKDTDESYARKREDYRAKWHSLCVWKCDVLRSATRKREVLLDLVEDYVRTKRRQNMAEFSDFTIAANQLVTRFPSIAAGYRRRYTHVLLDEYQDTSTTQSMLIAALFHPGSAVNAVGDPFQSIYAWRGASPGAFRMFIRDFGMAADTKPFPLSVTRRNSRIVLEAANGLTKPLRVTQRRASSSLMREVGVSELTALPDADEGTLGVLDFDTFGQEIDAVARFARHAIARYASGDGTDAHPHVAVLFRGGKERMTEFEQGLNRYGLTTMIVGYSELLKRPEVRDLLALLHVAADRTDSGELMRLLATPRFAFGRQTLSALSKLADRLDTAHRYRVLVEAGLVEPDAADSSDSGDSFDSSASSDSPQSADSSDGGAWSDEWIRRRERIVRQYRDRIPHAVFLADLLVRDDLAELLAKTDAMRGDDETIARLVHAGRMLRQVRSVMNNPLDEVIETAVEALGLDIDLVVAQSIAYPSRAINPTRARSSIDRFKAMTVTYVQEIAEGRKPTLSGFMAWIDSLKDVNDKNVEVPDTPVDVVLMTVHQAKGLEWDAVAVVNMKKGGFPSTQGGLSITDDERHPGGLEHGTWTPPEYHVSTKTWLDDPSAVPAPVRVDAGILPRFPHDADVSGGVEGAIAALDGLDDVEAIDDEIYGDLRRDDIGDDVDAVDPDDWYLTQGEEYGRRLLADERRIAYVALTRARHDLLITSSHSSDNTLVASDATGADRQSDKRNQPSVFWQEVYNMLAKHPGLIDASADAADKADSADSADSAVDMADVTADATADGTVDSAGGDTDDGNAVSLSAIGAARPTGFFVGENAADYLHTVVDEAWNAPIDLSQEDTEISWPVSPSEELLDRLRVTGLRAQAPHACSPVASDDDSLLVRARMLVSDPDLMPRSAEDDARIDAQVHAQAARLLASGRQNVTALQMRASERSERESRLLWRGMIRPIPRVVSPAAETGTLFHAWAERFMNAYGDDVMTDGMAALDATDGLMTSLAFGTDAAGESRESMIADLDRREQESDRLDAKQRLLMQWERRLVGSRWARRRPAWAERQIVVSMPQLFARHAATSADAGGDAANGAAGGATDNAIDEAIINGKLDAVFHGGLDESDPTKRYVIVDWKTGRRPARPDDVERKLVQLDWYRLLLSAMERVPLDSIDATLYYLSEPDEGRREIHARAKTEQEILAELSSGIPEQSDDD
ncbi:ATP-dependent DNA helicase [Bifidobacterium jacchi]|uniref:DNA 3'-5' helicase n=1 Tax=Bifidobacterium jacchi TaxID=2490545 RepID=A0A5N5RHC4_9BIFI|nr:ATP-dependent DNA helicase [Bifidobacterium jacchi]KAB5606644.1 ATP-dependent helicase [Bifidobacterium jacchi]